MFRRPRTFLRLSVMIVLGVGVLSCGGGAPTSGRIHSIQVPEHPPTAPVTSQLVIGVERFSATTPLNDWRILKYESPTQLRYYEEDRWVSEPANMIPELAAQMLKQMGIARQASLLPWVDKMDYVLQGQILNFEEVEIANKHAARVAIDLTLLKFPKREMVWNGTFRAEQPINTDGIPAAVEALSVATHEALKNGLDNLAQHLQQHP